ncbi:haloacid dehalogenase-like hydrolase [Streptomyces sp. NPDC049915]|uniref:haloacid dehalogenase-like hydrolase n=1 Tax=Streptomyces sp. NPDC049915 TaxID=3155510 RepID=UPI00342EBB39
MSGKSRPRLVTALALSLLAGSLAAGRPAVAEPAPRACPVLAPSPGWYGDNRARLQQLIDRHGRCGDGSHGTKDRPVAVFDWDNTVVKNDVGDATMFWLLRHDGIRQPAHRDWHTTSRHLTDAAVRALAAACSSSAPAGAPLPTATDTGCADEIRAVYSDGATTGGEHAFAGFGHRRTQPQYAWLAQLLQGWTPREVGEFAAAARAENLAAPVGTEQRVGSGRETGWVRYYAEQRDLIRTLQRSGFDVWITSASPEPVVEVWARGGGVDAAHTIGIRSVTAAGRLTAHLRGCGTVRDGEDALIPYIDGKRCWINTVVYGVHGAAAERPLPADRRQVFAAGDSDTDVTFLRDATVLRLVLNRNKTELMCRAYDDGDGRWIVNPMFLQPKPRRADPYPCATNGYENPDGTRGPVLRQDGSPVPDQWDRVYPQGL